MQTTCFPLAPFEVKCWVLHSGWERICSPRIGPLPIYSYFILLKYLFWFSCGQGLAGHWDAYVNKSSGCLPSGSMAVAQGCMLARILIPTQTELAHRTTFSGLPGAGKLPLSAGVPAGNLIFELLFQLAKGSPRKLQMFPRKDKKVHTLRSLSVAKLWLIWLLGHSHSNTSFLFYSWKNKSGREYLILETRNISKPLQSHKIFRTNTHISERLWANRSQLFH